MDIYGYAPWLKKYYLWKVFECYLELIYWVWNSKGIFWPRPWFMAHGPWPISKANISVGSSQTIRQSWTRSFSLENDRYFSSEALENPSSSLILLRQYQWPLIPTNPTTPPTFSNQSRTLARRRYNVWAQSS